MDELSSDCETASSPEVQDEDEVVEVEVVLEVDAIQHEEEEAVLEAEAKALFRQAFSLSLPDAIEALSSLAPWLTPKAAATKAASPKAVASAQGGTGCRGMWRFVAGRGLLPVFAGCCVCLYVAVLRCMIPCCGFCL